MKGRFLFAFSEIVSTTTVINICREFSDIFLILIFRCIFYILEKLIKRKLEAYRASKNKEGI